MEQIKFGIEINDQWSLLTTICNMSNNDHDIKDIAAVVVRNKQYFDAQCANALMWAVNFFPTDDPKFEDRLRLNLNAYKDIIDVCAPFIEQLGFAEAIRYQMLVDMHKIIYEKNKGTET